MTTTNKVLLLFMFEGMEKLPININIDHFQQRSKELFRDWYAKRWGVIESPILELEQADETRCMVRVIWIKAITRTKDGVAMHYTNLKGRHYCTLNVSLPESLHKNEKQTSLPIFGGE